MIQKRYGISLLAAWLFAGTVAAQSSGGVASATSSWVRVSLKKEAPKAAPATSPATKSGMQVFSEPFSDNKNGWRTVETAAYSLEIAGSSYRMRRKTGSREPALSFIPLPPEINLNQARRFVIQIELYGDEKVIPEGGLLLGVRDSVNYTMFSINAKRQALVKALANNTTFASYMPGTPLEMGGFVQSGRNLLRVEKLDQSLRFFINGKEVPGSPYPFRPLPGNGIGLTATGNWTVFRNLLVTATP